MSEFSKMRKKYTRLRRFNGSYVAVLTIGCQSFTVPQGGGTRYEAQWMRDMLAKALVALVEAERGGE